MKQSSLRAEFSQQVVQKFSEENLYVYGGKTR